MVFLRCPARLRFACSVSSAVTRPKTLRSRGVRRPNRSWSPSVRVAPRATGWSYLTFTGNSKAGTFAANGTAFPEASVKEMKLAALTGCSELEQGKFSGATPSHSCTYKDSDRGASLSFES
jgi:hypothetical protein